MFSKIATISFQSVLFLSIVAGQDRVPAPSQPIAVAAATGIAWRVDGRWQDSTGRLVHKGAAVAAGALVRPAETEGAHSLTVLLPDGQRIVNECFTAEDCSRGFRVPALNSEPVPFQAEMLRMAGDVVLLTAGGDLAVRRDVHATPPARDEAVVPIHAGSGGGEASVSIGGLLASLPAGRYTYTLLPVVGTVPGRFPKPLKKTSADPIFPVAGPGLYEVEVVDSLNTRRVNMMFAATLPGDASLRADFEHARTVLAAWDEQYYGWPVHDLLRAYLRARMTPPGKEQGAPGAGESSSPR